MWGADDTAETPGSQAQSWQSISSRASSNTPTFPPQQVVGGVVPPQMRPLRPNWDPSGAQAPWTQQQQSNAWVNPTAAGVSAAQPNGWSMNQQHPSQWGAAGSPNGSYADTAKKNVPAVIVANRGSNQQQRFEPAGAASWGGVKVDQHTPWDTGAAAAAAAAHESANNKPSDWSGRGGGAVDPRWNQQQQQQQMQPQSAAVWNTGAAEWQQQQQPQHRIDHAGTGHWSQPHSSVSAIVGAGVVTPSGGGANWSSGSVAAAGTTAAASGHHQPEQARLQYDPNPQTPGPWVPPQPTEMNNDMMWHDPNPKQKKVQRDTGTSVWGDPNSQVTHEIRRWKELDTEDQTLAAASGANQQQQSVWDSNYSQSAIVMSPSPSSATPSGWGDPSPPNATPNNGTDHWAGSAQQHNPPSSSSSSGWGESMKPVNNWKSGSTEEARKSNLDEPTLSSTNDTVFASVNSAQSTNASAQGTTGGPKIINGTTAMESIAQLQHMKQRTAGNGGENTQLSQLTNQIADQLRIAVQKGLININILNQPLPQQTLVLLNQLLQRVPKLEQANADLKQLRRMGESSSPTHAQQVDAERLEHEIAALQAEISSLQAKINGNTAGGMSLNIQQQQPNGMRLGHDQSNSGGGQSPATTPGDPSQSKLLQWKNGCGEFNEKFTHTAASESNLAQLVQGMSIGSRDTGDDWLSGKLEWSPPSSTDLPGSVDTTKSDDGSSLSHLLDKGGSMPAPSSTNHSSSATPTPPVDDGPQEFVPGKKWAWRDPKLYAEDPNVTPISYKPNPLLSSTGGGNGGGGSGPFGLNLAYGGNTGGALLPENGGKMNDPRFGMGGWGNAPMGFGGGAIDMWNPRSRPPSNQQQAPFASQRVGSYNRSMSSPGQSAFQSYHGTWTMIQANNLNEQQIRSFCNKIGPLVQTVMPPGMGICYVKFADSHAEQASLRLKSELINLGVNTKLVPDAEVANIVKRHTTTMMGGGGGAPPMWPQQQQQQIDQQQQQPAGWSGAGGLLQPPPMHTDHYHHQQSGGDDSRF